MSAVVAGEGALGPRVEPHVPQQVRARRVASPAHAAGKSALRVRAHVFAQALPVPERLVAERAYGQTLTFSLLTLTVGSSVLFSAVRGLCRGAGEALQHLSALTKEFFRAIIFMSV